MTQCRQSPFVRRTASPQNRIRDDPPACVVTEADGATAKSVWKQKNKSSTIKINGTMSKEIFVAFATQKGGIGKSTVTALAASYLHNVKGYNVAVVDCDDPQHSIHGLREHEMGLIDSSTYFKALACDHFRRIKKNAYTIVKSNAVNALDDAERMIATEDVKPDVVFFDMPGTLRSNGVIKTLSQMDYIFTPLSADRFVVESTLKFVTMFRDRLMTTGQAKTKGLHLFWTMVDGRERNDLYGIYEEVIAEMGFPAFEYVDMDKIQVKAGEGDEKPEEKVLDIPENIMDQIRLVSTYKGVHVPSMLFDSTGTKKIAAIASYVIEALEQGRILVVDELDSSIHFKLTRAIVAMFNNELNTNAQMIFTVHDINLMDCKRMFRKEQIWFVHKDEDGVYVYSLADFTAQQGVRDTTDIMEKYRKGALGALPDPELINSLLSIKGDVKGDDTVTGSSNFGKFIKLFESDDSGWIEEINRKLEE